MIDSGASGTAARVRTFRIKAGRSKDEMVQRLGLNPAWYEDIEKNDDEHQRSGSARTTMHDR